MTPHWTGVFPAITTQMDEDGSLDIEATARHAEVLLASGIKGLILPGSLGENQPMTGEEKRLLIGEMVKAVKGRVPVLSGVAETGTGIAYPMENQYVWELTRAGRWAEALPIYRCFTPLLHQDVSARFVQYIKLTVQECGLGKVWVRAPRLTLYMRGVLLLALVIVGVAAVFQLLLLLNPP